MCIRDSVEIVQAENCENDESADELDTENDMTGVPTATGTLSLLRRVRRFLEPNSEGEIFEHVYKLEQFIENQVVQNSVQKKITDYFKIKHCHYNNFKF